ncbi:cytochrome c biogenesis protein CcsA [Desulfovibrio sp. OttesenSCG-928-F07]|nr:cytochrome c biogenesis protein CcsA [Desulfovibrio sp. OttesenSCG-928-F07]
MAFIDVISPFIIILYALGSVGTFWGIPAARNKIQVAGRFLTIGAFALHTLVIVGMTLFLESDQLSRGYFVQLLAWCILLVYFLGWRVLKSNFLAMTAAPLAMLLFILSYKMEHAQIDLPAQLKELFLVLHIGSLFGSIGLLTLAFGAGLLFLHMDRKIKAKAKFSDFDRNLPALGAYDRINNIAVVFGFPLYTIGVAAGFIWAPMAWGRESGVLGSWDPKEVFSLFVWFLYAATFYMRMLRGWRGRKAALMIILIFCISIFSLFGVNFLMPTHHSFI